MRHRRSTYLFRAPGALTLATAVGLAACAGHGPSEAPTPARTDPAAMGDLGALPSEPTIQATPVVLSTQAWEFAGHDGAVVRTPHYRIYTTEPDERTRTRMAEFVEYALAHYRTAVTPLPAPGVKLDVYLMANRTQWETLTKRLMGPASGNLSNIERGGFAARGIGVYYDLGLYDTLAIAAHEGWHQYTQRVFADPLPVWLEEGMATYMEGHRWGLGGSGKPQFLSWANTERFDRLRDAVSAGREIPLDRLLGMSPQGELESGGDGLLDFYAHVWALTHFLEEGDGGRYRTQFHALLRDAADGNLRKVLATHLGWRAAQESLTRRVGDGVYRTYFGSDMAEANQAFHRFVRLVVRTGGREAVTQGRSPAG